MADKDKKDAAQEKLSGKALCKLVKGGVLKKDFEGYVGLVEKGKYVCKKCGRVARRKKSLCKGEKLQES